MCTEIIPTSQDRGRFVSNMAQGVEPTADRVGIQDRFRILAHVFFNGEYDENLAPENVQSICNALMLSESWMARVDSGHLTFKSFEGKVSITPEDMRRFTHQPAGIWHRNHRYR